MDHVFLTLINGGGPLCTVQRLKAQCGEALSNFGFKFNLRRYTLVSNTDVVPYVSFSKIPELQAGGGSLRTST